MRCLFAIVLGMAVLATACSGPKVVTLTPSAEQSADQRLAALRATATTSAKPVVAIVHAQWCEPCNELELHVLETPEGSALLDRAEVLSIDFDTAEGGALASRLRILGLPTTVVLRPGPTGLVEVGRIEGYETAGEYRTALDLALNRLEPAAPHCADDARPALPALQQPQELLATLECAASQLTGARATEALGLLRTFFGSQGWATAAGAWPEAERGRLFDAMRTLGRYEARVARLPARCASVFGVLAQWQGSPASKRPGAVYWSAACIARNGSPQTARKIMSAWIESQQDDVQAKELAADLYVHEHIESALAEQLLGAVLAATPTDDWAHYLLADLARAKGDLPGAKTHLETALALRPGVALYLNTLHRLTAPTAAP